MLEFHGFFCTWFVCESVLLKPPGTFVVKVFLEIFQHIAMCQNVLLKSSSKCLCEGVQLEHSDTLCISVFC